MCPLVYVLFGLITFSRFTDVAMVRHNLMLLRGGTGSGRTFSSLLNGGTFNDPHGNMSEWEWKDEDLPNADDFKVNIDPDWGNLTVLSVSCANALGDPVADVQFDVTSLTSSEFNDTTRLNASVIYSFPAVFTPDVLYVNETTNPLFAQLTHSNRVWNAPPLPDPKIMTLTYSEPFFILVPLDAVYAYLDGFIYVDRVSVEAQNQTGHQMLYTLHFQPGQEGNTIFDYYADTGGFKMYFDTDGVPVDLSRPLLAYGIRIEYEFPVLQSTIKLFGPTALTYVVYGEFTPTISSTSTEQPTSTSTEKPTSTEPPTSTTAAPTSTELQTSTAAASTSTAPPTSTQAVPTSAANQDYFIFLNMSVLINGSIYCPCTNVSQPTSNVSVDLAAIVANLTLDHSTLSKTTRRYTSATDDRTSSTAIGSFSIAIIVIFLGSIVFLDVPNLLSGLGQMKKNCVYVKKKLSNKRSSRCNVGTLSGTAETTLTVTTDVE